MKSKNAETVGAFFEDKWAIYQAIVASNALGHQQIFTALDTFLAEHYGNTPFTLVDLGCGDGSAIKNSLGKSSVSHYIGIDVAEDVLKNTDKTLAELACTKEFIAADMALALEQLTQPVDIIFSSLVFHHLSTEEKGALIGRLQEKLLPGGCFLLADGILLPEETRAQWLLRLEQRIRQSAVNVSEADLNALMEHPKEADFPETLARYRQFAQETGWADFQVLENVDDSNVLMLFRRHG